MYKKIDYLIESWQEKYPWTNGYGIARSLIALASLLTLLINRPEILFKPTAATADFPTCSMGFSIFCLGQNDYFQLNIIRWICILVLFLVVIGWRPRITGILHWYIAYSMQNGLVVIDGGEQAAAVITLLLIPITLTDSRKWHWTVNIDQSTINQTNINLKVVAYISHFFIRMQVAVLYFHSTIAKLGVPEWIDGTAVYYFTQDKLVGFNNFFSSITNSITSSPLIVIPTWGTLLIQLLIFGALFAPKKHWKKILIVALLMHEIFAIMLGLISFSLIMSGTLILFLTPIDKKVKTYYHFIGKKIPNKESEEFNYEKTVS